jgi:hypothetical protein
MSFFPLRKGLGYGLNFHGTARAGSDAEFTNTAFFLGKSHGHLWPFDEKGDCGTNRRTGPTVGALSFEPFNLLGGALYKNTLLLEVLDSFFEILFGAGQFQHHHTLFPGKYGGI